MAYSKVHFPILLLALLFINLPSQSSAGLLNFNIKLYSEMNAPITVSCQSRYEFFGNQTIQWGSYYNINIPVDMNIPSDSFVNCMFNGAGKSGIYSMFDYNRDHLHCFYQHCEWRLVPDGMYFVYDDVRHLVYRW
ncbi:hypothetical protein ACP275_07G060800 [Erythranthe tilingii]